jgi:hypothetical protein
VAARAWHPRRAQRLARYEAVVALHRQGHSHVAISRQTGLGRKTVRAGHLVGARMLCILVTFIVLTQRVGSV